MAKPKSKTVINLVGANCIRPHFEGKTQKGITLIALIITIIVMLILVGVTVTVALNGGLFRTAQDATSQTQIEAEKERLLDAMMGSLGNGAKVDFDKLSNNLPEGFEEIEGERTETTITVSGASGKNFIVNINRDITLEEIPTGTPIANSTNTIRIGDVVYVGDPNTKTATVYGTRGDVDYNQLFNQLMATILVTENEINIESKVEINGEKYTVNSIANYAFSNNSGGATSIRILKIPGSVTTIGSNAFIGCSNLTSIEIQSGVTTIGSTTFRGCSNLTSIEIPSSVTSIGSNTFEGCTGLTQITIPSSVSSMSGSVFFNCTNLTQITVYWPEGVKPEGWFDSWSDSSAKIVDGATGVEYN